jgi:hypothetical protein
MNSRQIAKSSWQLAVGKARLAVQKIKQCRLTNIQKSNK